MTDAKKLAGQLTKWCNTELGLKTTSNYQSGPVPHEFTQLCLGNNMKKVWKHIMENVRNATTVEKVKLTLQLHTLQEELVDTKTQLDTSNEEYDDVSKEIMLLEEKIKLKQSEISKSQIVNLSLRNDIQENHSKTLVQSSSSEQFLMKARQLGTETQMLKATVAENVDKRTKCGANSVGPCYHACLNDLVLLQGMVEDLVRNQTKQETDRNQPIVLWRAARHLVAK
uniref:Uncharacterized protein n=1 Tax=Ciona savignyi TaxID=51511 RepID=H2YAD7_CIOSA